ncbi:MAG: hypothetical protein M3R15_13965, partial [Acidobacteriota bacterium]|nr:hypothetical protein [Acidobacteriota bacterium]
FTLQATRFDGVRQQQFVVTDPRILDLFPGVPSIETLRAFAIRQTTRRVAPDARPPYTMQTSVSVERLLPLKLLLTTTFTNTRALHVLRSRNINAPLPGTFQAGVNGSGVRPFVDLGNIFQYETGGRFRQNQLAFALSKRFNPRLSLTGGYTLNKAETDTDGAGAFPADTYDLSSEMGRAVTDVRHHLTLTGTIDAPWGMRLSPLIVATSGRPFNITTGRDTNGDTLFTERPAFAIEPGKTGVVVTRYGAFDPNPAPGQRLIPRNYADGPSFFLVNLRLSRSFNFSGIGDLVRRRANGGHGNTNNSGGAGGKSGADNNNKARPAANRAERIYSLTFSVQAQNLLNHTNAGIPVGNLRSTFFGQSNTLARGFGFGDRPSAGNRRVEAQVTLRF